MCWQSKFGFSYYLKSYSCLSNQHLSFKENMIENELKILRKVKHPNIIKLVEEYRSKDSVYLIMEFLKVYKNESILLCVYV
jgi:serine/threonine protein kinase